MLIRADRRGEAVEERLDAIRGHLWYQVRERIVRIRINGPIDTGGCEALIGKAQYSHTSREPTAALAALLTDPRLILEEDPNALVRMCSCNFSQVFESPF